MSARTSHPSIPAEALARQARLGAALHAMETVGPSLEPACLQVLRSGIATGALPDQEIWIQTLQREDLVEEAAELLRASRRGAEDLALIQSLGSRLVPLAAKAQQRRTALWQLDTRRTRVRLEYAKENSVVGFDDGDLHALFIQAFRLEGLPLALDLGKRPRPLLSMGCPLPAGVGGQAEYMDAALKQEPAEDPAQVMARLNRRLPDGLRIHAWNVLPGFASEIGDLALRSLWRWEVPADQRAAAEAKTAAFLAAESWPWDRGTAKADASLDLRSLITSMHWESDALCFATRMGAFQAINPLKMLGALLGLDPASLTGLVRQSVELKPDARMGQAERFEPKLKNMYEDAVLLGGGSNIVLVDDDDDEPIRLG
ncbi:TIGR03936 family radical SAM-associated protein [Geothrix limicola]|uniref:TIGR03936 family radical SAM-associated protein n=1 Tax=Geothrix limicola TaxID=2927978 RepID=UPI002554EB83|nr:TIGR03936 family radical SAM-associated protein [Geothrix limicola]